MRAFHAHPPRPVRPAPGRPRKAQLCLSVAISCLLASSRAAEVYQWAMHVQPVHDGVAPGSAFGLSCLVAVGDTQPSQVQAHGHHQGKEEETTELVHISDCSPLRKNRAGQWRKVADPSGVWQAQLDTERPLLRGTGKTPGVLASIEEPLGSLNMYVIASPGTAHLQVLAQRS